MGERKSIPAGIDRMSPVQVFKCCCCWCWDGRHLSAGRSNSTPPTPPSLPPTALAGRDNQQSNWEIIQLNGRMADVELDGGETSIPRFSHRPISGRLICGIAGNPQRCGTAALRGSFHLLPLISDSIDTHTHTMSNYCRFHYMNFVEKMVPIPNLLTLISYSINLAAFWRFKIIVQYRPWLPRASLRWIQSFRLDHETETERFDSIKWTLLKKLCWFQINLNGFVNFSIKADISDWNVRIQVGVEWPLRSNSIKPPDVSSINSISFNW